MPPGCMSAQFGRRLTAPLLSKVTMRKCHNKFVALHLNASTAAAECKQQYRNSSYCTSSDSHASNNMAMHLLGSSVSSIDLGEYELKQLQQLHGKALKETTTMSQQQPLLNQETMHKKSPEKLPRNSRRRKRFPFLRRSAKSAPG